MHWAHRYYISIMDIPLFPTKSTLMGGFWSSGGLTSFLLLIYQVILQVQHFYQGSETSFHKFIISA